MKTFVTSHKKLCITLAVILLLILGCLIWIEVHISFDNLPLNKTSGTVDSIIHAPKDSGDDTTLLIKLDDSSSWPECEYAYVTYNIKDIKEGDRVSLLCGSMMLDSLPPYLTVFFMWKE